MGACFCAAACSSAAREGSTSSASAVASSRPSAAASEPPPPGSSAPPAASSGPEALADARAKLAGESARWLLEQRSTFLCTERVYPPPPSPHLTWWGWASPSPAAEVFAALTRAFPSASADTKTLTLSFTPAGASRPTMVVSVADVVKVAGVVAYPEGMPVCKEPLPAGAKAFVNVSELPLP